MAWWEWVGMKTQHFPIYRSQVADNQTLLMDLTFCIVICRRLLCQVSLCMSMRHCLRWHYMCRPISKIYQLCALFVFTGHLLSDRDTASSTGMGAGVNGNNQWECERTGLKKIFPLISSLDPSSRLRRSHRYFTRAISHAFVLQRPGTQLPRPDHICDTTTTTPRHAKTNNNRFYFYFDSSWRVVALREGIVTNRLKLGSCGFS